MASIERQISETSVKINFYKADFVLRLMLLGTTLAAGVIVLTGDQTVVLSLPFLPFPMTLNAKYNYSPAFIYFVVAVLVACMYSLLTAVVSALSISKTSPATKISFILACFDTVMLGVVTSATGAGASVAYVGLKGNSHVGWIQICSIYGSFCRHVGSSLIVSLMASAILIVLVMVSTYSLYLRNL